MTEKLAQLLNLPPVPTEPEEPSKEQAQQFVEENKAIISEVDTAIYKIDAALPLVRDLEASDEELDELARLAGIETEGNAFTGKLAQTKKGDSFELDGKKFKDTSNLDESKCPECGMDPCECDHDMEEGNEFSGELAQARAQHKDSFEVDGKTYPVKESTTLEDIARLSGIFQEGRDYGDTSFNEPPVYDNTPDECIQGEDVLLKGGDGEVAGGEKAMNSTKPTFKNGDNPLTKPALEDITLEASLAAEYESIKKVS